LIPYRGLWAVVVVGGLLRIVPVWFGLPYLEARPDEETAIGHALAILAGDPNPHFFHWPSLIFYVFAALFGVASRVRGVLSADPSLTPEQQILIARACVALAGTLTLVVLFRIGRRIEGPTTGLLAALFLAVSILHVRESHFAMTDVVMTLFLSASLGMILRGLDTQDLRWFAFAGLAGGLAASTKYSAAAIAAGMAAAQLLLLMRERLRQSAASPGAFLPAALFVVAFAAGFLAATPFALLDSRNFVSGVRYNFAHLSEGHVVDLGRGWTYHLVRSLPYGAGPATFIAAIAGTVPFARYYRDCAFVVAAFALALYVSIGSGHTVFFRYALPLIPVVCLLAAVGVQHASRWAAPRTGLSNQAVAALLAAVVAVPAAVNSAWFDLLLARTDSRAVAAEWLVAHSQPEQTLYEAPDPYTQLNLRGARLHMWGFDASTQSFAGAGEQVPDWLVLHESPLWTYARIPPALRRLADDRYELAHVVRATKGASRSAVYDLQDAFFMPISKFSTVERPGPTVLIYRKRNQ
jgi:hypothetical protein